jgi:5-dehydro-2-deoxygluconokinase
MPRLMALAIDHRTQLEDVPGATPGKIAAFKRLAVKAAARVAAGRPGYGMLIDDKHGREALYDAGREGNLWIARPVELPGSRPLRFEFSQDLGSRLIEWPVDHTIKVLCFYHPDDPEALRSEQIGRLAQAQDAARKIGRELLIEIIASRAGPMDDGTVARALGQLYGAGLKPDWWKLEPQTSPRAWEEIDRVIETSDPYCRGVVLLGLDAPQELLEQGFAAAGAARTVKGFAVGRTIFAEAARAWFAGTMSDDQAVSDMARRFESLTETWQRLAQTQAA